MDKYTAEQFIVERVQIPQDGEYRWLDMAVDVLGPFRPYDYPFSYGMPLSVLIEVHTGIGP